MMSKSVKAFGDYLLNTSWVIDCGFHSKVKRDGSLRYQIDTLTFEISWTHLFINTVSVISLVVEFRAAIKLAARLPGGHLGK